MGKIIFRADMRLSVHIDNKGNDILIIDEGAHKDYMTPH